MTVEIDGEPVDGLFGRQAERGDPGDVPGSDVSAVAWVRRSDTGEIERFLQSDIKAKPAADVRIAIGEPAEAMHQERRAATTAFAEGLRATAGLSVDLEITERQPVRVGLGHIEWTSIFIAPTVAATRRSDLTSELYVKASELLLEWKAKGGRPIKGLVIHGPDGEVLLRWDTERGVYVAREG